MLVYLRVIPRLCTADPSQRIWRGKATRKIVALMRAQKTLKAKRIQRLYRYTPGVPPLYGSVLHCRFAFMAAGRMLLCRTYATRLKNLKTTYNTLISDFQQFQTAGYAAPLFAFVCLD